MLEKGPKWVLTYYTRIVGLALTPDLVGASKSKNKPYTI